MDKSRKQLIANFIRENVFDYTFTSTLKVAKDNPEVFFCCDVEETKETIEIIFDELPHNKRKGEWSFFITDDEDEKVYLDDTDKTLTLDDGKEYFIIESCCPHKEYASYHYMIEKEKIDKILLDCKYLEEFSIEVIKVKLFTKKLIDEHCYIFFLLQFRQYKSFQNKMINFILYNMLEHENKNLYEGNFINIINKFEYNYQKCLLSLLEIYYLNGTDNFFELINKFDNKELKKTHQNSSLEEVLKPLRYLLLNILNEFVENSGILDFVDRDDIKGERS